MMGMTQDPTHQAYAGMVPPLGHAHPGQPLRGTGPPGFPVGYPPHNKAFSQNMAQQQQDGRHRPDGKRSRSGSRSPKKRRSNSKTRRSRHRLSRSRDRRRHSPRCRSNEQRAREKERGTDSWKDCQSPKLTH
ncbi:SR-related and CTD-associated factor 4-like [Coregonus clupeaformis]|uniref:SR-related and CTD-associated factor 4-like n=1 Tax=Coregonus clupeaformis TaxID=59861 RepID=UPI001BDFE60E|nr:SR-related and CTD-associated factor 4-like [Coregonus clupeaformis]